MMDTSVTVVSHDPTSIKTVKFADVVKFVEAEPQIGCTYDADADEIHVFLYSGTRGIVRSWRIPTSALARFEIEPQGV